MSKTQTRSSDVGRRLDEAAQIPFGDAMQRLLVARRAPVLMGAVVGAYAVTTGGGGPGDPTDAEILGVVGGGTAAGVGRSQEQVTQVGPDEYLRTDE